MVGRRRELARGVTVSELGFGAAPLGGEYGPIDQETSNACVAEALRLGITYFDTAPYYGRTKSEIALGTALEASGAERDQFQVSTKVARYDVSGFDFSPERVAPSIRESLSRLRLSHVDLAIVHDIEFCPRGGSWVAQNTVRALQRLREEGLVKTIGVSGLPLKALSECVSAAEPGALDVVLSYCHLTIRDRTLLGFIDKHGGDGGVSVINASPLGMGLMTTSGGMDWHPAPQGVKDACKRAALAVRSQYNNGPDVGDPMARVALEFSLREAQRLNGKVATTLVGMKDIASVVSNHNAVAEPMDESTYVKLLSAAEKELEQVRDISWPSGI